MPGRGLRGERKSIRIQGHVPRKKEILLEIHERLLSPPDLLGSARKTSANAPQIRFPRPRIAYHEVQFWASGRPDSRLADEYVAALSSSP